MKRRSSKDSDVSLVAMSLLQMGLDVRDCDVVSKRNLCGSASGASAADLFFTKLRFFW